MSVEAEFRPSAKDIAYTPVLAVMTTTTRNALTGMKAGVTVFDSTLHFPVTWDGAAWRDGAGNSV